MARIVCFGELLLRMSPPAGTLMLQDRTLDVHVGGAEANVAVALAGLGHEAAMVSLAPEGPLGDAAVAHLRRHGVDVAGVARAPGRIGIYFLTPGAGLRAAEILYDRADSAFARATPGLFDWPRLLAGADRLHLSGITPAIGPGTAALALEAAAAADAAGVPVSFDGNWRGRMWAAWDSDPRAVLSEIVGRADLLFGNHRDVALLTGATLDGGTPEGRRRAAEAAFAAFPRLRLIASTHREADAAEHHRLAARVDAREEGVETEPLALTGIVDRIGGGDAFAAGVLDALARGAAPADIARTGLALAALKHSVAGDNAAFTRAELAGFGVGGLDVRR